MTCKTCEASRFIDGMLMCRIMQVPATKVCRWYVYEPGTTDEINGGNQ